MQIPSPTAVESITLKFDSLIIIIIAPLLAASVSVKQQCLLHLHCQDRQVYKVRPELNQGKKESALTENGTMKSPLFFGDCLAMVPNSLSS